MTAPEPLTLTLEEALQRLYAKGRTLIPPGGDTDSWGAVSAVLGMPVVPRDDTAELVEALAEPLRYFLEWREEIESDLGIWASKSQTREAFDQAEAALARVKGER